MIRPWHVALAALLVTTAASTVLILVRWKRPADVSRQMEATIRKGFALAAREDFQMKSLVCRATRCRAELAFPNAKADKRALDRVFRESDEIPYTWTVESRVVAPDGTIVATMYFDHARKAPY